MRLADNKDSVRRQIGSLVCKGELAKIAACDFDFGLTFTVFPTGELDVLLQPVPDPEGDAVPLPQ